MKKPTHPIRDTSQATASIALVAAILLAMGLVALLVVVGFANEQYQRDVQAWRLRLDTIANIRAAAVEDWLENQYEELRSIAGNVSLRLYVTELNQAGNGKGEAAQITFLRNYLAVTAERTGFALAVPSAEIKASVPISHQAGIALLDNKGTLLVATPGMPAPNEILKTFIQQAPKAQESMNDIFRTENGVVSMAFLVPVYAVQGDPVAEDQIGWVFGVKPVATELYPLLNFPRQAEETAETALVREQGGMVEYLSPLRDGSLPLTRKLDHSEGQAASFAMKQPGHFSVKYDYGHDEVLTTGRAIKGTGWTLVQMISADEALRESEQRRLALVGAGLLGIGLVLVGFFAVWRHGTSVRYRQLAEKFKSQEALLRLVSDNQPDAMMIIDQEATYRFANLQAARDLETSVEDMVGRKVKHLLGPEKAGAMEAIGQTVLERDAPATQVERREKEGTARVLQVKYLPLQHIPDILTDTISAGMLVIEQDITPAMMERERRERLLKHLVDKLVLVIDKRDTYAAHHSARVALLAEALAQELKLSPAETETVGVAGKLMNIGRILVPPGLFAKKGRLTSRERSQIAASLQASADFLEGLEFEGPVVETLRQVQEHYDGSGPLGLKGEQIFITAQIVAIANAYIAMTSPRAWRPGIEREKALEELMQLSERQFRRRVVAGLVNLIESHKGTAPWEAIEQG